MSQKELKNTNQPKTAYQLGEYDYSFSFGVPKGFYKVNYSCKKNEVFPRISKPLFRVNLGFFHFILFPDKSNIFCFILPAVVLSFVIFPLNVNYAGYFNYTSW